MDQCLGSSSTILSMCRCWRMTTMKLMLSTSTTLMRDHRSKVIKNLADQLVVPTCCTHACEVMCCTIPTLSTLVSHIYPYCISDRLVWACVILSRYTCAYGSISHAILHYPFDTPLLTANHFENLECQLQEPPCALTIPKIQNYFKTSLGMCCPGILHIRIKLKV